MHRDQESRLAELGNIFRQEISDVINMHEPTSVRDEPAPEYRYHTEVQPIRSMNDDLAQHEVQVRQVHNGFVVNVGCQSFVFESFDKLSKYMKMYFENPNDITEKHTKGELFK